jgi:pyruvate dehydrogenase E2 component (dihydrolipoyllysine-residue acetyltransferase)
MEVRLPKLGEGAESGTVVSILVRDGDRIERGQTILELENEKAVAPIPSPASGRIQSLKVAEGDKLSVGQVILSLAGDGTEEIAPAQSASPKAKANAKAETPGKTVPEDQAGEEAATEKERSGRAGEETSQTEEREESQRGGDALEAEEETPASVAAAAPSLRKLARQLGIDLTRVRGSERGGRVVMADVRAYLQRLQKRAEAPKPARAKTTPAAPAPNIDFSKWGPVRKQPLSPMRQTISRRMAENWATIPHVTQFDEADITDLMALRKENAERYEQKGAKLTLTPFALKAVVEALKKHPALNCSLDESSREIVFKEYYHLGLAVDTEQGLLVPVIRDVDKKTMLDLAKEVQTLAEKARERKVTLEEMKGGTFTISNQGGIGGAHFTPIINKPEAAILGLGRAALKPVVRNGRIEPRLLLPLGLSYDHRLIDGAAAARFIVDLLRAMESFPEEAVREGVGS